MPAPPAATISVRATLDMLDGPKRELADGVANDRYVFWLGSGISRERMPDLRDLAKRILIELQARVVSADNACRFRKALTAVVALTTPSDDEQSGIDFSLSPDQWPAFDILAARLINNYARMLNVTVDGEEADYLLWDILNAASIYADATIEPDAEHLCLAALAIEGAASEMPSANWDPLVERAISLLAGAQPILRVAVAPSDVRSARRRANLYKFHGCALAALNNPGEFRKHLIARQSQINGWVANNPVVAPFLTHLIVTRPTLMLGLSAQDSNIQGLFAAAEAQLAWRWPSHPPAYAFSENALGGDQESLLQNVYHLDYTPEHRPLMEDEALVQAYAKPLLLALYLFVITAKLKMLVTHKLPDLADADREKLHRGLEHARNHISEGLEPTAIAVSELLTLSGRAMTMLRDGTLPDASGGVYVPISPDAIDRMPADPTLAGSGVCEFAIASGLIGLGLERGLWTAEKPDAADATSGALLLSGRSGPARVYFAASQRAAIRLGTNGLIADNDDAVIIHSHENPPAMPRSPRRPPGRTGLATVREVSLEELLASGSEVEDLLERFRSKVAL
ncbi:SIR2 family protein [uncultured Brevundimonas sp.]|uniref:SIR2 family protein n=1 Tax=uncultured Brevundimonas sp. TaxID=213418 RepID=UPI0030ED8ADD|tara:strand:+ start:44138 stop:45847 length:1710 start_codon:yes stop_codon:yes gene_type:complete